MGPTLSLFSVKDGPCIGGFTNAQWTAGVGTYNKDSKAILFNLSDEKIFNCEQASAAIQCNGGQGPCFGARDLVSFAPFNVENKFASFTKNTYNIGVDKEGRNMLTGSKSERFTIIEMEVWQIMGPIPVSKNGKK